MPSARAPAQPPVAPPDAAFLQHCRELLAPLGAVRTRRMFGGHALYADKLCVALLLREQLYLKTDDSTQAAFAAAGSQPFTYATRTDRRTALSYWAAPDEAMDSAAAMLPWARLAQAAALRKAALAAAEAAAKAQRAAARKAAKARQPSPGRPKTV